MSTLSPLLQVDNEISVIKFGAMAFAYLSENLETHKKILKSQALNTLTMLIKKNSHFDINKYCVITLSNMAESIDNYDTLLDLDIVEYIIVKELDISDHETQYYILRLLYKMSMFSEEKDHSMSLKLLRKEFLEPILRCISGIDEKVIQMAIDLLR